jgi:hypothetical protein
LTCLGAIVAYPLQIAMTTPPISGGFCGIIQVYTEFNRNSKKLLMMKTKNNVYLSGYWWFPVRKFEFEMGQSLSETIEHIQNMQQKGLLFGYRTKVTFKGKNKEGQESFSLRKTIGRYTHIYINGQIQNMDNTVMIQGKLSMGNLFILAFLFCTFFLLMGRVFILYLIRTGSMISLIYAIFPFGFLLIYWYMLSQRDLVFKNFVQIVQTEKAKSKRGTELYNV